MPIREAVHREIVLSAVPENPQVRLGRSRERVEEMAASLKEHGQLQPLGILETGGRMELIWGFCRLAAMRLLGWKKAWAQVYQGPMAAAEKTVLQVIENIVRTDLPVVDQAIAVRRLVEECGLDQKAVAAQCSKSQTWASNMMAPWRCIPAWQEAFIGGAVGVTDCAAVWNLTEQQQHEALAGKLGDQLSRDELVRRVQRKRRGDSETKVSRVRFPLPSGVSITLAAAELTLEGALDAVVEAAKAIRKGIADGLDGKTFQAAMACKVKQ